MMSKQQAQYGDRPQFITIAKAYERWKHMDHLLSDWQCPGDNHKQEILYDLWQAIKHGRELPAWFRIQGMSTMDEVAAVMEALQKELFNYRQAKELALRKIATQNECSLLE